MFDDCMSIRSSFFLYCYKKLIGCFRLQRTNKQLVEVNDPLNTSSQERTMTPGLSEAQESEVVHRKLEGFASQYYTLLKSQLEQQRIYFEGQLEEIRREHTDHSNKEHKTLTTADLVAALKAERSQLSQRLETLKARNAKVADDLSFIVNLNEGLEANREPLRQQVQQTQREQLAQRQMFESCLPPLQEKVTRLMLQLETGTSVGNELVVDDRKPAATTG
jgi:chromosome segregation ATPase